MAWQRPERRIQRLNDIVQKFRHIHSLSGDDVAGLVQIAIAQDLELARLTGRTPIIEPPKARNEAEIIEAFRQALANGWTGREEPTNG
ncbi:MAG: hypothetical protein Q8R28_09505 [Dehalococcoidia bacterium]|nr:hypothetical protein [Dehalococcoidia bacterium]